VAFVEVARDAGGLALGGAQEAPDVGFEFGDVERAAAAEGVGLDV
jgi:hypothetical protein